MAAKKQKPRSIRFAPDPGTLAEIRFEEQNLQVYGLVVNESMGGFAVVLTTEARIMVGMICTCRVGKLSWAHAEIRWLKDLETNLYKIGFQYHL